MWSCTTVRIDDDFATGQTAITLWTTDDETAGWIDQVIDLLADHLFGQHRLHDLFNNGLGQRGVLDLRMMLSREHDGVDLFRTAIDVFDRDLRLRIRSQPVEFAGFAQLSLTFNQSV